VRAGRHPQGIHDLRHTFASLFVSGGASLEMIGKLLGHTQIGTTQRYAHLIESPLRAGVNAVGEKLRPRLKVVGRHNSGVADKFLQGIAEGRSGEQPEEVAAGANCRLRSSS
jgi:hypothetical protein